MANLEFCQLNSLVRTRLINGSRGQAISQEPELDIDFKLLYFHAKTLGICRNDEYDGHLVAYRTCPK